MANDDAPFRKWKQEQVHERRKIRLSWYSTKSLSDDIAFSDFAY
jgi:hypothetical protein